MAEVIKRELIHPLQGKAEGVACGKRVISSKLERYTNRTISFWITFNGANPIFYDGKNYISTSGDYYSYPYNGFSLSFNKIVVYMDGVVRSKDIGVFLKTNNKNHHIVITIDIKKAITIYANGVIAGSMELDLDYLSDYRNPTCYDDTNLANIFQVRDFNYTMTAEEVTKLYNGGRCDEVVLEGNMKSGCIAEYLPASLTPKVWRDTSGQGNHLTATGTPELIYDKPYKEVISGNGAPTVIPDVIGQTYIDNANGNVYISNNTVSASNWKLTN